MENQQILDKMKIWATYSKASTQKVKPGDYVVFYVVGTGLLYGSYRIKSDWYEKKDLVWADEKLEQKKMYHYQCDLEPHVVGYSVYAMLAPKLDFVTNKENPQAYVMGIHGGPGNFQRPISQEDFLRIIEDMKEEAISPPGPEEEEEETEHESIVSWLLEIGTSLGFSASDSPQDTNIAKGSRVDATWITRISNLGEIRYVFEVQIKGSIDSLLLNLLRASANPTVRRIVVVSKSDLMDKIKGEAETLPSDFRSKLSLWSTSDVKLLHELVSKLNEEKTRLGIGL